jgi:FAD/FMN-containing dehydrogenase
MDSLPDAFVSACIAALGRGAVIADPAEVRRYTVDFWGQVEGSSPLVLRPGSTAEVAEVVALAARHRVPLVPQAGNTGLMAGAVPDGSGRQVVLSLGRLDRIRQVDAAGECLVAEAGVTLANVQAAAESVDRLFPLSLGSEGSCQIGGNLSTNAGGINVLRYGMARDLVLGLEVVLADGRAWNGLRTLRKDNTGYDLKQLFIGAEGSLGIITAAALRLFPRARETQTLFLGVASPEIAVELLARAKGRFAELVSSFELMHGGCIEAAIRHLPGMRRVLDTPAPWYLLIEIAWSLPEGLTPQVDAFLEQVFEGGQVLDGTRTESEAQRALLWRMRESMSEAMKEEGVIARNDVSVPIACIPELIARGDRIVAELYPEGRLMPFGHVGDGNLHFNVVLPGNIQDFPRVRDRLQHAILDAVQELGGSISAEHGIGRLKRAQLERRKPALDIELMRRLKRALDPAGILNPGVIV